MTKYLNKTGIEWCNATWNPVTGCLHGCPFCYARKMYRRFNRSFAPTFHEERLFAPCNHKKHLRIFTGSVTDLFGEWVDGDWIYKVFSVMSAADWHTFFLLTKNPRGIRKLYDESTNWYLGGGDYYPNIFLGVSVTGQEDVLKIDELWKQWSGPKFISFEPLLEPIDSVDLTDIDWVIIGAQTQPSKWVDTVWVEKITNEARRKNIPVFMKNNLHPYVMRIYDPLPQEFPK